MKRPAARTLAGIYVAALAILTLVAPGHAASLSCSAAAGVAEASTGVPPGLLLAIGKIESGRPDAAGELAPWPWAIQAEGVGHFFSTSEDAVAAVRDMRATGVQSIDIGCFQINLYYHPHAFADLASGFDPLANALAAARFLISLREEFGAWEPAVAAYHSRLEAEGVVYRDRVLATWHQTGRLGGDVFAAAMPFAQIRYPGIHVWGPSGPIGIGFNVSTSAPRIMTADGHPRMTSRLPRVLTVSAR